jgi:DHA2 family multidrug resistance protein
VKPKHPQLLLPLVAVLTSLEFLQSSMVAFASGPIMGDIQASPQEYSCIAVVYACIAVAMIAKHRWLVERLGWRHFVLLSLGCFALGSAVCAASGSMTPFLAGRVLMAVGGASFMTAARVLINLIPPGPGRFVGIKYFATGLAAGTTLGPWIASFAVGEDRWPAVFWALAAVAVAAGVLARLSLSAEISPRETRTQSHPGLMMLLIGGSFLLFYTLQSAYYDFFNDGILLLAVGVVAAMALSYFAAAEHRRERPLLHFKQLAQPRYWLGVLLFTACYIVLGANNYMLPLVLQRGFGLTLDVIGKYLGLGALASMLTWFAMARVLPHRPGPKKFLVLGFMALAAFGWQLSMLTPSADLSLWVPPALACNGIFIMLVLATTAMQTFRDVQKHETAFSHANQIKNMLGQFGMAAGIAMATLVQQWRLTEHYAQLSTFITLGNNTYTSMVASLTAHFSTVAEPVAAGRMALAQISQIVSQQATLMAGIDYFWAMALFGACMAVLMLFQRAFR